ncbi:MAG: amidase [Pseudomonadota bacterium]
MTAKIDWTAVLADQGVPDDTIAAARDTAARHTSIGEALLQNPAEAAGVEAYAALLRAEAKRVDPAHRRPPPPTEDEGIETTAARLAVKDVSALELTQDHLARLAELPELNAVARLERDAAEAAAAETDAQRKPGMRPLAGVPLAHKDLYARKGWRLEAGAQLLTGNIAPRTAHAISRLDAAGLLDLGRLNTVEFALGPDGRNVHTGAVRNPWNIDHVPGGSSSGSGAAIAAGMVPAALGSDTGGSIRLPAAACGLAGLKPTAGLIGRSGVFPLSGSLDTVGPLARTVRDAAILTQTMAGFDSDDPQSVDLPPPDLMGGIEDGLRGLRIGVAERYFLDPLTTEVANALEGARRLFETEGARLTPVEMPGIDLANRLNVLIINVEAATQHREWIANRAADYGAGTLARIISGLFVSAPAYLAALGHRARLLQLQLDGPLSEVDAILTPVWSSEPPRIDEAGGGVEHTGHSTRPANYLGLPAITVPCGLSANGLPIGVQLIGRPFSEAMLLRAARGFERARMFWADHKPSRHLSN